VQSADSLVQQYCLSCFCLLAFVKKAAQLKSIHMWLWLSLHSSCKWHKRQLTYNAACCQNYRYTGHLTHFETDCARERILLNDLYFVHLNVSFKNYRLLFTGLVCITQQHKTNCSTKYTKIKVKLKKHVTQICKAITITSKILRNITDIIQHHWWDRKEAKSYDIPY